VSQTSCKFAQGEKSVRAFFHARERTRAVGHLGHQSLSQCGRTVDEFAKVGRVHDANPRRLHGPSTSAPRFHAGEGQDPDGLPGCNDKDVCRRVAIASKVNLAIEDDMELGCRVAFPHEEVPRFEAANFQLAGNPFGCFWALVGEKWQLQKLFGGYSFGSRLRHRTSYRLRMYWRMK
jgi:hypothetical protein